MATKKTKTPDVSETPEKTPEPVEAAPKAPKTAKAPKAEPKPPKAEPKAPTETVIIQHEGAEWELAALREKAITAYVAENHRRGSIKDLVLYVKPEERKVYYVVNGKNTGSADFE